MAYTSLKALLFAAALQNAGLVFLLGSWSPLLLRWFDNQLPQYSSAFPAVVVKQVTNPQAYATSGRLPTSWARVQFDIYGAGTDSQSADAVAQALYSFLDTFNGDGITGRPQSPNYILSDRDDGIAETLPLTYKRIVEARIFWNPNTAEV